MALETLLSKEEIEEAKSRVERLQGKEFSIDPNEGYQRKDFAKSADRLFDLQEHYAELVKNVHNRQALEDVIGDIFNFVTGEKDPKSPNYIVNQFFENPHHVVNEAKRILDEGEKNMVYYVDNKRNQLLSMLDEEQLYSLAMSPELPFYKTGNPKYDKITELKKKLMQMEKAKEEKQDPSVVVQQEVRELLKKLSPRQRKFAEENPQLVIGSIAEFMLQKIQKGYKELFRTPKGDYDKNAMREYLEANYDVIEDTMRDAVNEGDIADVWKYNLKPHYLGIAKLLLKSEKKAQKREDNPTREDWKDVSRTKGIRI